MTARKAYFDRSMLAFLALLAGLLALRIACLQLSPLNLHFDEAQYWDWSRSLEWGYFSKPPLIAWAIAATTRVFGDSEWAVRLSAPVAQAFAALAVYGLGRSAYGAKAGFWAGLGWLLLPAVTLSSGIISTDALLLAFWSIALFALWRLIAARAWVWAPVLGAAVGFGALAKYAMLYFILCAVIAALWSKPAKAALMSAQGAVAGVIAAAVLAPNLVWNFTHGFATIQHTAANARLNGNFVNPGALIEFLGSQFAVIGPLFFLALVWLLLRAGGQARTLSDPDRTLLAFILPPLVIIMAEAFISRANANWAAAAYPAAIAWIAGNLATSKRGLRYLFAANALNLLLGAVVTVAAVEPEMADAACIPGKHPLCLSNSLKRARGWDEVARQVELRALPRAGQQPFTAIMVDHRATYFELAYYWREARARGEHLPPVRMWQLHANARNSAEQVDPMRPQESARVLVVHAIPDYVSLVAGDFASFRTVDHFTVPLGSAPPRTYEISVGEGFSPAPRDAAFERRVLDPDGQDQGGS